MSFSMQARVVQNKIPGLLAKFPRESDLIADKVAHDIEQGAMVRTTRVDTGAMKGGYKVEKLGPGRYKVYNTQGYQIFHELGTVFLTATPMLIPAAQAAEPGFQAAFQRLASLE